MNPYEQHPPDRTASVIEQAHIEAYYNYLSAQMMIMELKQKVQQLIEKAKKNES